MRLLRIPLSLSLFLSRLKMHINISERGLEAGIIARERARVASAGGLLSLLLFHDFCALQT